MQMLRQASKASKAPSTQRQAFIKRERRQAPKDKTANPCTSRDMEAGTSNSCGGQFREGIQGSSQLQIHHSRVRMQRSHILRTQHIERVRANGDDSAAFRALLRSLALPIYLPGLLTVLANSVTIPVGPRSRGRAAAAVLGVQEQRAGQGQRSLHQE